ncbi:glycosyltransferase family 2 protein [Treponema sp. C6A8]|uniref:glycosyltransferase family 2 protein n=1 Tax=Treponema sp. C6A8 TaxID=1410609 RepID=UPI0009DDDEF7|nr:glycosyltransferase family 2 protein [Treponema sp. C6A8]
MELQNLLISVCIPVYNTEKYLSQCLRSVYTQNFDSFEIVVVSDASPGKDSEGHSAKKIIKLARKESEKYRKENHLQLIPIRFIELKENRGLIEVRRTLMYEARGIYMTQCDSDDEMEAGALKALFSAGEYDIIHGTSTAGYYDKSGSFIPTPENRYGKIFYGEINGRKILMKWLLDGAFTANTWGKLIKHEIWQKAYEHIPYTECNMADDVLLFFFIVQYAKSYKGIEEKVYRYRVNTGMTSARKIDSLHKWKMVCSAASVFTVISEWIKENPGKLSDEEVNHIRKMTSYYLLNNLQQLKETVIPELQAAARQMLCDYWGKSFVERLEQ